MEMIVSLHKEISSSLEDVSEDLAEQEVVEKTEALVTLMEGYGSAVMEYKSQLNSYVSQIVNEDDLNHVLDDFTVLAENLAEESLSLKEEVETAIGETVVDEEVLNGLVEKVESYQDNVDDLSTDFGSYFNLVKSFDDKTVYGHFYSFYTCKDKCWRNP